MRWPYFLQHKLKIALLLCIILIAVFVNNRIESGIISRLGSSFTSVYEDRLVVESYIFQLSNHLHNKKHILNEVSANESKIIQDKINVANTAINQLVTDFEKTKLTTQEDSLLNLFKNELKLLEVSENKYILSHSPQKFILLNEYFSRGFHLLSGLSAVQMIEGKNLYENSQKAVLSNASAAQFELALIIIIGLIILSLIFESKKISTTFNQNINLN